ncbi:MAG: hypothetical protein PVG51_09215 [Desulfosarcina sp.]
MKRFKWLLVAGAVCGLICLTAMGCEKEGPAEKAGKKVDEMVDSARKGFKKMTDD